MENDDKDVEIKVEDDAAPVPEQDIVVEKAETGAKASSAEVSTDDALENLKSQLAQEKQDKETERQARLDAENRARQAAEQAFSAQNEVEDTNLQLINTAIQTVQGQQAMMRAEYAAALRAGDFDAAANVQEHMSAAAAKLLQLENGKQAMEAAPKREAPRMAPPDPVEALASQLSPRSAAWVRAHPEYATDQRKLQKMIAAHNLVTADGIAPDTDGYFNAIENVLQVRAPAPEPMEDPTEVAATVTKRRSSPAAAPVSRSGTTPGSRPNTVRLSPAQIEAAQISGMTPEEYARQLIRSEREGKLH